MSWLNNLINNSKLNNINKIKKKKTLKNSIYCSDKLYINEIYERIKIIKLSNENKIYTYLNSINLDNCDIVYLIPLQIYLNLNMINSFVDIIIVDLTWCVTHLYHNVKPSDLGKIFLKKTSYIYVLHKNSIIKFDIKLNDIVRPF